jgi:lysophospholipase L1-like esterase
MRFHKFENFSILNLAFSLILLVVSTPLRADAPSASRPAPNPQLPTLFIVGDSTVKNRLPLVGWGDPIADFFDLGRINVENHAMAGRSSRTFIAEGRWETVRSKLKKGDFVLIQFGHNDSKMKLSMDRYSLPGLGEETEDAVDSKTHEKIVIHTFGFYMKRMIAETLAAGAMPVVLSPVPRCKWADGKIVRGEENHAAWDAEIAKAADVSYIDLNAIIANVYDPIGKAKIKALYFPGDNTHNNLAGARLNAACVVRGLLDLPKPSAAEFLRDDADRTSQEEISSAATEAEKLILPPTTQPTTKS